MELRAKGAKALKESHGEGAKQRLRLAEALYVRKARRPFFKVHTLQPIFGEPMFPR